MYRNLINVMVLLILSGVITGHSEAQFPVPVSGDCDISPSPFFTEFEDACGSPSPQVHRFNFSFTDLYLHWSSEGSLPADCVTINEHDSILGQLYLCGLWWDQNCVLLELDWHASEFGHDDEAFSGIYESQLGYLYLHWTETGIDVPRPGANSASGGLPGSAPPHPSGCNFD